jgi:hypothetical protein
MSLVLSSYVTTDLKISDLCDARIVPWGQMWCALTEVSQTAGNLSVDSCFLIFLEDINTTLRNVIT